MDHISGTLSVPLAPATLRPQGDVFVQVVAKLAPNQWQVTWKGQVLIVQTTSELHPGQLVAVKLAPTVVPMAAGQPLLTLPPVSTSPQLVAAFVANGLALTPARLQVAERWLRARATSDGFDREHWASTRAARDWPESGATDERLEAWLSWENRLARGERQPPPPQEGFWELWNSTPQKGNRRWVVCPFQWDAGGEPEWALLKAGFDSPVLKLACWSVVAAPAGVGCQITYSHAGGAGRMVLGVENKQVHQALNRRWPGLQAAWSATGVHFTVELRDRFEFPEAIASYCPGELNEQR